MKHQKKLEVILMLMAPMAVINIALMVAWLIVK